jgi:hypothetical protein
VNTRVGDAVRTIAYDGTAVVDNIDFRWVAEFADTGLQISATPVVGGKWDTEGEFWTLPDGQIVASEKMNLLLDGLGSVLQGVTNKAAEAAGEAYEAAVTESLGDISLQRGLFL